MMAARGLTAEAVADANEAQAIVDALLRGGPYAAPEVDECRALWAAVLLECWLTAAMAPRLAVPGADKLKDSRERNRAECRDWFGSPDFHLVCAFIGFDSDAVLAAFRAGVVPVVASKTKGRSKESRGQVA